MARTSPRSLMMPLNMALKLGRTAIGFQDILAGFYRLAACEAGRVDKTLEAESGDRRDAVAADQARRAEPGEAIDQAIAQQRGGEMRAALGEHPRHAARAERPQPRRHVDPGAAIGIDLDELDAAGAERLLAQRIAVAQGEEPGRRPSRIGDDARGQGNAQAAVDD